MELLFVSSLTSGTAQRRGHSFVHDEQCSIQAWALHGHLYLLNARIQGSLSGLLSREHIITLAAHLRCRWPHGCSSRGTA